METWTLTSIPHLFSKYNSRWVYEDSLKVTAWLVPRWVSKRVGWRYREAMSGFEFCSYPPLDPSGSPWPCRLTTARDHSWSRYPGSCAACAVWVNVNSGQCIDNAEIIPRISHIVGSFTHWEFFQSALHWSLALVWYRYLLASILSNCQPLHDLVKNCAIAKSNHHAPDKCINSKQLYLELRVIRSINL